MARLFKAAAESWPYVLISDRGLPVDQQTRFVLRPLSQAERMAAEDECYYLSFDAAGSATHIAREKRVARQLALSHIVSIENFPVGAPRPWPGVEDLEGRNKYLEQFHSDDVLEVGNEIFRRSKLGVEAEALKNSSPPAPTSGSGGISEAIAATPTTG